MLAMIIMACSIVLQVTGAALAYRLVHITGKRTPWLLLSVAFSLMAAGGIVSFLRSLLGGASVPVDLLSELVGLTLSLILVLGVSRIAPFLRVFFEGQKALRESEERYHSLMEQAGDGIFMHDATGRIMDVNRKACEDLGYSRDELLSKSIGDIDPAAIQAGKDALWPKVFGGEQFTFESYHVRKDGSVLPVEVRLSSLVLPWGRAIVGIVRDLTERKRAEEQLRASERKFRDIFEHSNVGKALSATDGTMLKVNKAFADMLGYRVEGLEGLNFADITHPDDIAASRECVRSLVAGEREAYHFEKRYVHKDGHTVWAEVHTLLHRPAGEPPHFMATILDITERRKADQELAIRNRITNTFLVAPSDVELYSEVLDVVREAMRSEYGVFGYLDEQGSLVAPSMTRRVWTQCQVANKSIVFPRDAWGDSAWARAIREQKTVCSIAPSAKVPEGHVPIQRHLALPILYRGETIGLLQVANKETDYTAEDIQRLESIGRHIAPLLGLRLQRDREEASRKKAEDALRRLNLQLEERIKERTAQLEAVNKELEAFSYSVSHDLRAPLRAIAGFSRALADDYGDKLDPEAHRLIDIIQKSTAQMGALIDGLLAFSRRTRKELSNDAIDMAALAQDAWQTVQHAFPGRSLHVEIGPLGFARGDRDMIREVFVNLLSNATKFTALRKEAYIEVGAREEETEVVYYVKDNGVGFDMKYADKLFGVFQRLHSAKEFEGTGIGLALVQRIIQRHGGRVWAEGTVGEGATFYFSLPRKETTDGRLAKG